MSITRKVLRRRLRSESALDLKFELVAGKRYNSPAKQAKKQSRLIVRAQRTGLLLTQLLIKATGAHDV